MGELGNFGKINSRDLQFYPYLVQDQILEL